LAGFTAIASAGKSIERILNAAFADVQPISGKTTHAVLVRTTDFEEANVPTAIGSPALSIYLYRADFNKNMRATWSAIGSQDGQAHLVLDLHFLLTAWADNAEFEHRIIGRSMQVLETTPVLSGPLLEGSANWALTESVQLVLEEISTEAVMRTFDSLPTDYRLSIPYIARMVRIDSLSPIVTPPVTTLISGTVGSLS
jgi:Pvc16 N-terminal domain